MNRIQQFLECDEINESVTNIKELKSDGSKVILDPDVAIQFRFNGCFHWGLKNDDPKPLESHHPLVRSKSMFAPHSESRDHESNSNKMELENSLEASLESSATDEFSINSTAAKVIAKEISFHQNKTPDQ